MYTQLNGTELEKNFIKNLYDVDGNIPVSQLIHNDRSTPENSKVTLKVSKILQP